MQASPTSNCKSKHLLIYIKERKSHGLTNLKQSMERQAKNTFSMTATLALLA
jgi:hypothetical protein